MLLRDSRSCSTVRFFHSSFSFFFFNDTATTEIYTLSLHDALPILREVSRPRWAGDGRRAAPVGPQRSEEHTSELQSQSNLVCRLLLEKKKTAAGAAQVLVDVRLRNVVATVTVTRGQTIPNMTPKD